MKFVKVVGKLFPLFSCAVAVATSDSKGGATRLTSVTEKVIFTNFYSFFVVEKVKVLIYRTTPASPPPPFQAEMISYLLH